MSFISHCLKLTTCAALSLKILSGRNHRSIHAIRFVASIALVLVGMGGAWLAVTSVAYNNGRPDVIWMRGGHIADVRSMDYSPDGQLLVSIGDNSTAGMIKVWRLSDGMLIRTLKVFSAYASAVRFLPDSQTVVVTGSESDALYLKRVQVSDGQVMWATVMPLGADSTHVAIMPNGNIFVRGFQIYRSSDGGLITNASQGFYRSSNGTKVVFGTFNDGSISGNGNIGVSLALGSSGARYPAIIDPTDCYFDSASLITRCLVAAYFPNLTVGLKAVTPDGSQILSFGGSNLWNVYRRSDACSPATPLQDCPLSPAVATISAGSEFTFSPDGQSLSTATNDFYYLYDVSSWSLRFPAKPRTGGYATTAFSPDNQIVATNDYPAGSISPLMARINFSRVSDGSAAGVLNSHFGNVNSVTFSPDGQLFATADNGSDSRFNDRMVRIWRASDGTLLNSFVADANSVNSIAFSPDGQYLATGGNGSIGLWNVSTGTQFKNFPFSGFVHSIAFSPDGTKLLTGGINPPLRVNLWNLQTTTPQVIRSFLSTNGYTKAVAISPDGQTMAATDNSFSSTTISFWKISDGTFLRSITTSGDVSSIAFSPDSQSLIAGLHESNRSSRVRQWQVSNGQSIRDYVGHLNWVDSVTFSPDGNVVMSGGVDGIRIWNAFTGDELRYFDDEIGVFPFSTSSGNPNILSVVFSPDGSKIGYGRSDATAVVASYPLNQMPTANAGLDQLAVEATSSNGALVTLDGSLSSDLDGSIVTYEWKEGANLVGQGVQVILPVSLGNHTYVLTVTDNNGAASSDTVEVNVVDTTPPTLTLPNNITVAATNAGGAVVSYATSASDFVDGTITPTCTPESGSNFAVGDTTVTCSAIDAHGNVSQGSFTITVTYSSAATHFSLSTSPVTTAGSNLSVVVTALDDANNKVINYNGAVHFTSSDGAAVLPSDYSFVVKPNQQAASGSSILIHQDFNSLAVSGIGQKFVASSPMTINSVTVQFANGFPKVGYIYMDLVKDDGSGKPSNAAADIIATSANVNNGGGAGNFSFNFPSVSIPVGSFHLVVRTQNISANGYSTLTLITSTATTINGLEPATVQSPTTGVWSVAAPSQFIFFSVNDPVFGDAGQHVFNVALKTAGTQSITVTDTANPTTTGTQGGIIVQPANTAGNIQVTGFPSATDAGTAGSFTVTIKDPYGNVDTGYTGTIHFTSSDSQAVLPPDYNFLRKIEQLNTGSSILIHQDFQQLTVSGIAQKLVTTAAMTVNSVSVEFINSFPKNGYLYLDLVKDDGSGKPSNSSADILATSSNVNTGGAGGNFIFHFPSITIPAGAFHLVLRTQNISANGYSALSLITSTSPTLAGLDPVMVQNPFTGTWSAAAPTQQMFFSITAGEGGTHTFTARFNTLGIQSITATDIAVASVTGSQSGILVQDTMAPLPNVTSLPDITAECSATVTTIPTATDVSVGTVVGTTTDPLTYSTQGTFYVHWNYDDGHGNIATQLQRVIIDDVTSPLPTQNNLPDVKGQCTVTISTAPSATDNCRGAINGTTSDPLTYNVPGSYDIHWNYDDGNGNITSQIQKVIVAAPDATPSVVTPGDPNWQAYEPNTSRVSVTTANPRSGFGSLELDNNSALIKSGAPLGTYGNLNALSFDWFIQSFTDPFLGTRSLPPDIALRVYNYGDPRTFFLHWDTCSPAAGCNPYPIGSWQSTDLLNRLSIQQAEGNTPPASLADIPADAPITEITVRGSYSFGGPWHGFVDNVNIGFSCDSPITFNFEPRSNLRDLVGWWRAEGNAIDSAGFNHGWTQGTTFTNGKYGQSFSFDGIDDFVSVNDRSSLNVGQHTLGAWIYVQGMNGPYSGIIVKQNPNNTGRNFYLGLTGNRVLHYSIQSGADYKMLNSNSSVPLNTWTYVAAVYDGTAMRLYINGVEDTNLTVGSLTPATTTQPLRIGWTNENDVRYFHGNIDEVQIFKRALSGNELSAIYEGLVAWWKYDGDTTDSINDNDGTPRSVATYVPGKFSEAISFGSDYVQVPNFSSWEFQQFSVATWVRSRTPNSPGFYNYLLSLGAVNCNGGTAFQLQTDNTGGLRFGVGLFSGAQTADAGPGIWDGNWHYVVGTYDGAFVRLYVDGNQIGNGVAYSGPINYSGLAMKDLIIGDFMGSPSCGAFKFNGDLDEVKIYNRALSAVEARNDMTAPVVTTSLSPLPNAAGWNNTDVSVTLTAADIDGSGVKEISYRATGAQTIPLTVVSGISTLIEFNSEGESTLTFFATDHAGNASAPQTLTIKLDKTLPMISCGSSNGIWHAVDISIACTSNDSLSGLTNAVDASFSLATNVSDGTETANALTSSHTVCDVAGNCAIAGPVAGNLIDKKRPTISLTAPAQGGVYLLNSLVAANYSCSDGGAGLNSCVGTVPAESNIDTSSLGQKSFQVNAVDKVGNAVSFALNYFVKGPTSTKLTSNLNPSTYGATIIFMANVNSTNGAPTGNVQFYDGSALIGSAVLASGKAKLVISSLAVGTHQISAVYVGNDQYLSSTSPVVAQVVDLAPTTCLLTSSKNPSAYLASVTFTVQVTANQPGYIPDGIVRFSTDGGGAGPFTLDATGRASVTFKFLTAGSKMVRVLYAGTSNFASCENSLTQVVKPR